MRSGAISIPSRLEAEVSRFQGGTGRQWLARLPQLLAECRERWSLRLAEPFAYPSLSFVAPAALEGGGEAVLKVGFLHEELASEAAALRVFDGRGAARLLDADLDRGALLLERLRPGSCLAELPDDEEAFAIAAAAMRRLWRPAPRDHAFRSLADWAAGLSKLRARYDGGTGPLPVSIVERGEALWRDLLASPEPPMLLHGDFQHFNLLRAEREPWLAIDPKGVVGDPGFEVGPLLANEWMRHADPARLLARRVDHLAAGLGMARSRVCAWGLAYAVLSAWWHLEDSDHCPDEMLRYLELIAAVPE